MTPSFTRLALSAVALALFGACAAARVDPEPAPVVATATSPDLSWMTGHWRNAGATGFSEEIWSSSEGGMMLAVSRTVRGGEVVMFEYMRVELGDTPALIAQPGGGDGTVFALVETGPQRAVFANPDNEYPTHIEYARDGEDLTARIWGADGPGSGPGWRWARVGGVHTP